MKLFRWLLSFFWKPKQLPKPVSLLEGNSIVVNNGEIDFSNQYDPSHLDELDRMMLSVTDEVEEFEAVTRTKIHAGDYFKLAFQKQIEYIKRPTSSNIIIAGHVKLTEREFVVFSEEFRKICESKGIGCQKFTNTAVQIDMTSFQEYIQRCKNAAKTPATIRTSEYR